MGFEPTTFCMASRRSSQLSYSRSAAAKYSPAVDGTPRHTDGRERARPPMTSARANSHLVLVGFGSFHGFCALPVGSGSGSGFGSTVGSGSGVGAGAPVAIAARNVSNAGFGE
jgi:hypothetical protein